MKATLNSRIRSKVFDIAVVLVTIPIGILLGLLGPILPLNARFWIVKTWRHCFTFFEHKILGISIEIVGSEHIPNVPASSFRIINQLGKRLAYKAFSIHVSLF